MIELENETEHPLLADLFDPIADALSDRPIELLIVDDESITALNRDHRGKETPTDVLSFPLEPVFGAPLGSIVISLDTARVQAAQVGHSLEEELKVLFLHGLLHLLGFDHECDKGEMAQKEQQLRQQFGLGLTLTQRE